MLTTKHPPQRNIINVADPIQVKKLTKRLGISKDALLGVVEKCGNSIAAISKEVENGRVAEVPGSQST
jgi:Protein of unknown function (DUF3606)